MWKACSCHLATRRDWPLPCGVAADVDLRRRLGEQAAQRARAYGSKPMVQKLSALYTRLAGTPELGSKAVVA